MMNNKAIFPNGPENWSATYSPAVAVKAANLLFISGQVAFDDEGKVVGLGDIVAQARKIFDNIRILLNRAGLDFGDVIKTNYYVTDVAQFSKVVSLRKEYFSEVFPASTMVEVKGLVHKDLMLEIEAVAVLKK
jgi:2-iminobutanoate/2-iminopropanoate deaminase